MQRKNIYLLMCLALFFFFITSISGYQISLKNSNSLNVYKTDSYIREKREIEEFDNDDYPTPSAQEAEEEPSFWDRIVKVALRMFNKFIEWLNSS